MAWEYQQLLNQNLQILFVLGLGALCAWLQIFNQGTDLRAFNKLVFAILLPSAVLLGLGLRTDLRDGSIWQFIAGFLMLRAITLVWNTLLFWKRGIAAITANWLFASWVSTIVLGVPLLRAALGPQYSNLGVVAGISSFIFQLPAMLILFEIDKGKKLKGRQETEKSNNSLPPRSVENLPNQEGRIQSESNGSHATVPPLTELPAEATTTTTTANKSQLLSKEQAKVIGKLLIKNPILWAILIGIILSVTTLGPRYLNPGNPPLQPNCDYAPGAGFIFLILSSLATCVQPIALFATGIFLSHKSPIRCGWHVAIGYMVVKLILVPSLMVGCAAAVGLEAGPARAAVLLASLPISAAAFTLCDRYNTWLDHAVANIFWGTVLVLPTTLAWMAFMDAVDLFPMVKTPVNDACTETAAPD